MTERAHGFVPPHSVDAERAVLGGILRDANQLHLLNDRVQLRPEHFFHDTNRRIFSAMVALEHQSQPLDIITLSEELGVAHGASDTVPLSYLIDLTENTPYSQNSEHYGSIVKKKFYLRRIISACQETVQKAVNLEGGVTHFIEGIEKEFLQITNEYDTRAGLVSAKEVLIPTLEELERRIRSEGTITGISSGFRDLDQYTGGWQRSDLIILAARPGMGKTALGLNWVTNAVKSDPKLRAAIFTLEMSKEQLMERLLSAESKVDSTRLRKGDLTEDDQDRIMHGARVINEIGNRLMIDETPGISMTELRSRCRRHQKEQGLNLVVIDYLQLMSGSAVAQKQGREREIGEISMGLKALAKELAIPVVALAQLNRGPDARPDKRPRISDLRESGSMEQDADQIMFVYRDEYYNPNSELNGRAELMIAKNRHGETGTVTLAWLPNFVSFHNLLRAD